MERHEQVTRQESWANIQPYVHSSSKLKEKKKRWGTWYSNLKFFNQKKTSLLNLNQMHMASKKKKKNALLQRKGEVVKQTETVKRETDFAPFFNCGLYPEPQSGHRANEGLKTRQTHTKIKGTTATPQSKETEVWEQAHQSKRRSQGCQSWPRHLRSSNKGCSCLDKQDSQRSANVNLTL